MYSNRYEEKPKRKSFVKKVLKTAAIAGIGAGAGAYLMKKKGTAKIVPTSSAVDVSKAAHNQAPMSVSTSPKQQTSSPKSASAPTRTSAPTPPEQTLPSKSSQTTPKKRTQAEDDYELIKNKVAPHSNIHPQDRTPQQKKEYKEAKDKMRGQNITYTSEELAALRRYTAGALD